MGPSVSPGERTTQERVDLWFTDRGVPTFADKYPLGKLIPVFTAPLIVVAAAQLATMPVLTLETWQIMVGPAVVTLVALPVLPTLRWMLDPDPAGNRPRPSFALGVIAVTVAAGIFALLIVTGDDDASVVAVASNLGVLLAALVAFVILLRPELRAPKPRQPGVLDWLLPVLVLAAVIGFAVQSVPGAPVDTRELGALEDAPTALPAVPVSILVLILAVAMSRRTEGQAKITGRTSAALFSVSPFLVFLMGMETTLLPELGRPWIEAVAPLAILVFAFALAWRPHRAVQVQHAARQLAGRHSDTSVTVKRLAPIVAVYLFLYPIATYLVDRANFEVALAANFVYLIIAAAVVIVGIDRMAVWMGRKLRRDRKEIALSALRGLPLLLVFTAFLLFTNELWQVASAKPGWKFLTLAAAVVAVTLLLLFLQALKDVKQYSCFASWNVLRERALRRKSSREAPDEDVADVYALLAEAGLFEKERGVELSDPPDDLALTRRRHLNILGVVGIYQALIFVPLFLVAFGVLLGTSLLVIPNELVDNWVNGDMDAANPREIEDFREGGFLEWPWTRVAIFLAALSVLYVAVDVLRTPESRGQFFAGADEGVSQRLAVRRAYEERLPIWSTDAADPSGPRSSPDSASERGSPTVASPASGRPS